MNAKFQTRRALTLAASSILLAASNAEALSLAHPPTWSVTVTAIPLTYKPEKLKYRWGRGFAILNEAGKSGNRGGFMTDEPLPTEPLVISWESPSGVELTYAVDIFKILKGKAPIRKTIEVAVKPAGLEINILSDRQADDPPNAFIHREPIFKSN